MSRFLSIDTDTPGSLKRALGRWAIVGMLAVGGANSAWQFARAVVPEAALFAQRFPRCDPLFTASEDYRATLRQVRAQVPEDGQYVLLDHATDGAVVLVQGDLAPRRALLMDEGELQRRLRRDEPVPSITVVHLGENQPLRLIATSDFRGSR